MHYRLLLAALSSLMLAMGCGQPRTNVQPSVEPLTVEETVGLVFTLWHHGTQWNYYVQANPKAKPHLYKIIGDRTLARYWQNAILAIGYIGDKADALRLKESLHRDYKGTLNPNEQDAVRATFDALAIMSRRGISEASDMLDKMLARSYWEEIQFRWRPEGHPFPLNTVDELISWALYAYAKTARADEFQDRIDQVINAIDGDQRSEILTKHNRMEVLLAIEKQIREKESEPISEQLRQQLPKNFNGDLESPGERGERLAESGPSPSAPTARAEPRRTGDVKAFSAAVAPSLLEWMELHKQEQALRHKLGYGIRDSQEYKQLAARTNAARKVFAIALEANWPYETDPATLQMLAGAIQARDDARQVHQAYREGKGNRDESMAKWLSITDRFAGTIESDEAFFSAGMLYLQHLRPGMQMDILAAQKLYERLVARPGPPSQWTLMAEENLVSFPGDPTERFKTRSDFVKDLAGRLDEQWLRTRMLVPIKTSTPDRFIRQIDDFLLILAAARRTTARNMVSDAKGTANPRETLQRLKEVHAGDPHVEAALAPVDQRRPK